VSHLPLLLVWGGLWAAGGVWLARAAFQLRRGELLLVGLVVGIASENLFANLLARVLPLPGAFWAAAGLTAALGLGLALRGGRKDLLPFAWREIPWGTLTALLCAGAFLFSLGRGLAIFDDFAHLPVVSMMAAGDIPPHFPLDPGVPYYYHYFSLLFAAQVMALTGQFAWTALDLVRALAAALALVLTYQWARRVTRSAAAGVMASVVILFASGARWLLFLLPDATLDRISGAVSLIGSGAGSGGNLNAALASAWAVEGGGPLIFPFAFVNGVFQPGLFGQLIGNGLTETAFVLALLLPVKRWRGVWRGALAAGLICSASLLLTEAGVLLELAAWGLIALIAALRARGLRLPSSLWGWLAAVLGGNLVGLLLGGALTGILARQFGTAPLDTHHTIGFQLVFPPTLVSAHLGVLSLFNFDQLLAALAELGPLLLALPLVAAWGWKALRAGRWYEAALAGEGLLALGVLALGVQFNGSEGVRNTARLYRFMFILSIYALPLGWLWLRRRAAWLRWAGAGLLASALLGGVVLLGAALPALQNPVSTYFVHELDSRMGRLYWDRLEPGALIFDPTPVRAPTLFGRFTSGMTSWYASKAEWHALTSNPRPDLLAKAGYTYAYLGSEYYDHLPAAIQLAWETGCPKLVHEEAYPAVWRRLYDLRGCRAD